MGELCVFWKYLESRYLNGLILTGRHRNQPKSDPEPLALECME